jgi:hypothetical protein
MYFWRKQSIYYAFTFHDNNNVLQIAIQANMLRKINTSIHSFTHSSFVKYGTIPIFVTMQLDFNLFGFYLNELKGL